MTLTSPTGSDIEVSDISHRLMNVPLGTTLRVPDRHEWYITGVAIMPTRGYTPPLGAGETRDARAWGDLQIRVNDQPDAHFRANVLTLIDRYWGRFNLNPSLPELVAKLTEAQQVMFTAPKLSELYTLMDHLVIKHMEYIDAAAPRLDKPVVLQGGVQCMIEHVPSDGPAVAEVMTDTQLGNFDIKILRALDVELSVIVKRPVS